MFGSGTLEGGSVLGNEEDGGPWQLFETPIAVGVAVRNPIALAAFLVAVQGMISSSAPDLVDFVPVDPYHGVRFVQVAPSPRGEVARELLRNRKATDSSTVTLPSVYYGTVGSAWYIATQRGVLERLVDTRDAATSAGGGRVVEYSALGLFLPANARQSGPGIERALTSATLMGVSRGLAHAWLLYRCGAAGEKRPLSEAARGFYGQDIPPASAGGVAYDPAADDVTGGLGSVRNPRADAVTPDNSPLVRLFRSIAAVRVWLRFSEEGLLTHVEMERTQGRQ